MSYESLTLATTEGRGGTRGQTRNSSFPRQAARLSSRVFKWIIIQR